MKQIETDKAFFDKGLGLSCIENYLLYVLTYLNLDFKPLYAKSYVAISDIAQSFCNEKIPFAYFNKTPRLQNIACDIGVLQLINKKVLGDIEVNSSYCCIRVSQRFVEERYARELWRKDHFVLICGKHDGKYLLLNDIPRDVIEVNEQRLIAAYDGEVVCFNILKESIPDEIKGKLLNEFQTSLAQGCSAYEFAFDNLETARDSIGIIRVTRKRIREYCSIYFDTDFMSDYISRIDKTYAMLEYMRLRNRTDYDKVNQSLSEIQENDLRVIERLNQEMRMI